MSHLRGLALGIGPRPATSAAEQQASAYCAEKLRESGYQVSMQSFSSVRTFSWPWLLSGGLLVVAGGLLWVPAVGGWLPALLAALGAVCFWGLATGNLEVGRLFAQGGSQNVIGVLPARAAARRRVVLVAHVDSTRAALLFAPSQVRSFGKTFALNIAMVVLLLTSAFGLALAPDLAPWRWLSLPATLALAYGVLLLLHREAFCQWVQGANDNASGVAVCLSLAARLAAAPLAQTEVWFVFTGCEEVGAPVGMRRFLSHYGPRLREASFLVVDNLGAGNLRYLAGEGTGRFHRADPGMLAMAAELTSQHPEWRGGVSRVPLGSYTDALPALAAGYRTLAVWAERDGVLPNWHWPTDVLERVEPDALDRGVAFLRELLLRLDQDAA